MTQVNDISVIVPSKNGHVDLLKIVNSLCCQTCKPTEIIIVDSSLHGDFCSKEILALCTSNGIKLIYKHFKHSFPGHARNIGLKSACANLIAFVDVQTIPKEDWLEASLKVLSNNHIAGVFGSTYFTAQSFFEKLIRDAFYGVLPRKTLPGSVFRREVFIKAGQFIECVRAGEDTEWMLRLDILKIPVDKTLFGLIDYVGLIGMDLKTILRKWYRNYTASHDLPHLYPQKLFLWLVLYPLMIFVALNWNYLFANWHEDSPLYIAHITKMAAIFPIFAYVVTRGIVLPLRRGVGFANILPFRFIAIAAISFMADAVKAYVFTIPRRKSHKQCS
ncbi:Glyco_tranf_GTA_type domain containing protein [Methylophilaceae bacterium]